MITVYHLKKKAFRFACRNAFSGKLKDYVSSLPLSAFKMVAEIHSADLNRAYELTNTIDLDWWANPLVYSNGYPHRSTSVGDIMEENGHWFVVSPVGFAELEEPYK